MPIQHVNRKGQIYYLHQSTRKDGKPHYYFSTKEDASKLAEELPEGREVFEKPETGQVYLRKAQKSLVSDEELALARSLVAEYCTVPSYAVMVERTKKEIIVYESQSSSVDVGESTNAFLKLGKTLAGAPELTGNPQVQNLVAQLALAETRVETVNEALAKDATFSPVFKYVLLKTSGKAKRQFESYRFHWTTESWASLGYGPLEAVLKASLPHMGEDSYYDLGM